MQSLIRTKVLDISVFINKFLIIKHTLTTAQLGCAFFSKGERKMFREYEELMLKAEYAELQAAMYSEADDAKLVTFYMNAAVGFKMRALALGVGEA